MTNEELIIGHYDKTLSADEEQLLQQRMSESPEARAMFDQMGTVGAAMTKDASRISPSSRLDEVTVAAVLSLIPQTIGGGLFAWLTGKVAIGITAVVVGGVSVVLLTRDGGSGESNTRPAPSASAPVTNAPATPAAPASAPAAPASAPAASGVATPGDEVAAAPAARSNGDAKRPATTSKPNTKPGTAKAPLGVDNSAVPTIVTPPQTRQPK